jgi:HEPN domain-containing protein
MTEDDKDYIQEWLIKADHDIIAARTLISTRVDILDTVCFHCQQAIEKYFKAFLLYQRQRIKKTHFVSYLQVKCAEIDKEFAQIDLKRLDDFAVDIRYPDDAVAPTLEEAKEYLQIAEAVKELVRSKIIFNTN